MGRKPGSERESLLTLGTTRTDEWIPSLHWSQVRPRVFPSVTQGPESSPARAGGGGAPLSLSRIAVSPGKGT